MKTLIVAFLLLFTGSAFGAEITGLVHKMTLRGDNSWVSLDVLDPTNGACPTFINDGGIPKFMVYFGQGEVQQPFLSMLWSAKLIGKKVKIYFDTNKKVNAYCKFLGMDLVE